jgi:broad specificity phosphatase PhoE
MQGQKNSDLNELGQRQAEITARLLATLGIQAIFASPLNRARQTTAIIQRHVDVEVRFDARIMEWDCGDWSGYLYEDVKKQWPDEWAALEADRFNYRGPNCENYPDMIKRATPFVRELIAIPLDNVAIVSHGMIGRVMIGMLMGFTEAEMLGFAQPNHVVYRVGVPAYSKSDRERELHHYVAAAGPFEGTVDRW